MKKQRNGEAPLVGVVVLNYNGIAHVEDCFSSLMKMNYQTAEFVMVDNASSDGSQDYVRRRWLNVHVIQNKRNLHFARAMNVGMSYFLGKGVDYIAILNADVEVEPSWLFEMVKVMESCSNTGAVASLMMYYHNRKIINGLGVSFNPMAYAWDRHQGKIFRQSMGQPEEVFSFCGGAALLNVEALRQVGFFDPWHKSFLEDVDLCIRMRAHGWRIYTAPSAVIYHKFSASFKHCSPLKNYFILRNRLKIALQYFSKRELLPIAIRKIVAKEVRITHHLLSRHEWYRAMLQVRAFVDALLAFPKILRWRIANISKYKGSCSRLLEPSYEPSILPYFSWDYERADRAEIQEDRIIMGVSDRLLGDGWYPLDLSPPQCRWMTVEADCFLRAEQGIPGIVQIHVRQPFRLRRAQRLDVFMDGVRIGSAVIRPGDWRTLHFGCVPSKDVARLAFRLDRVLPVDVDKGRPDLGLQFNEISLLRDGSPFLRAADYPGATAAPSS
ncbi:MAG: glycosyltransferase family 2 protein [Candidatus Tritonobacter lacicola]|nr:glycosyltransferase family 2 protein [Candidatus Tritonobacter lacicola]